MNDASYSLYYFLRSLFCCFTVGIQRVQEYVCVKFGHILILFGFIFIFFVFSFLFVYILSTVEMWLQTIDHIEIKAIKLRIMVCCAIVLCLYKCVEWYRSDLYYFVCAWKWKRDNLLLPLGLSLSSLFISLYSTFFFSVLFYMHSDSSTACVYFLFLFSLFNAIHVGIPKLR